MCVGIGLAEKEEKNIKKSRVGGIIYNHLLRFTGETHHVGKNTTNKKSDGGIIDVA